MRNLMAVQFVALLTVLAFSSTVMAQIPQAQNQPAPPAYIAEGIPAMPNPPGPAPKEDLTGAWIGPINLVLGPFPAMTPAGEARFKLNKPTIHAGDDRVTASNDPFFGCDPLGSPRELRLPSQFGHGGLRFQPIPGGMLIVYELQRVWRDISTDGRQLPAKVDARGYPDSRYYGFSVGHWEGDNVFVVDSTGLDPRTWLDEVGHPHTNAAKVQERYTRTDQYNLELTVTVDDPTFYTKPYQLMKGRFYWKKNQDLDEVLCIPSEAVGYQQKLADPSGWGPDGKPAK